MTQTIRTNVQRPLPTLDDTLAVWRQVRGAQPTWRTTPSMLVEARLSPTRCLLQHTADGSRSDRPRALRLMAATAAMAASTSTTLRFAELASWQRLVLGGPAPFRGDDAFAKGGRERMGESDAAELDAFFADADVGDGDDDHAPLWWRAARLYADVLFVHPFVDGNARSARLALTWLLRREGATVRGLDPVWRMPWSPHSVGALARTMRACLGQP